MVSLKLFKLLFYKLTGLFDPTFITSVRFRTFILHSILVAIFSVFYCFFLTTTYTLHGYSDTFWPVLWLEWGLVWEPSVLGAVPDEQEMNSPVLLLLTFM